MKKFRAFDEMWYWLRMQFESPVLVRLVCWSKVM
jgi:hypothetical protein